MREGSGGLRIEGEAGEAARGGHRSSSGTRPRRRETPPPTRQEETLHRTYVRTLSSTHHAANNHAAARDDGDTETSCRNEFSTWIPLDRSVQTLYTCARGEFQQQRTGSRSR